MEEQILEPASTSYEDWTGSAAAENSMIKGSGDLYALAGLDRDEWTILAIDLHTFSHGKPSNWTVSVYAANRQELAADNYEALKAVEAERGSIPVTEIMLHDVSLEDVVRCMKVLHVQLTSSNFPRLNIVDRTDFPLQD